MTDPYANPIPAPAPYEPVTNFPGPDTPDTGTDGWSEDDLHLEPSKPAPDEVYKSLNYFDEIAVKRCFGEELLGLKKRPGAFMRALVFSILRKEEGLKDQAAQDRVFAMPNGEVTSYFHLEAPAAKCTNSACPCPEHVDKDEDEDADPTQLLD